MESSSTVLRKLMKNIYIEKNWLVLLLHSNVFIVVNIFFQLCHENSAKLVACLGMPLVRPVVT